MDPLISVDDLSQEVAGALPPVLLDVRWSLLGPPGKQDYDRDHLPGAVFVDLDTELAAPPGAGGRHPLPAAADLQAALRRAGVTADREVVAYDADNGSAAARAWWLLRWAGHPRVRVLDGGYRAWVARGNPVTAEVPEVVPTDFQVVPDSLPVIDADEAARLAGDGRLLDARAPERYRGEVEPVDPRAGHIPGARNAPFAANVTEDGTWRTPQDVAALFQELGVDGSSPVGAYCGSGVTACSTLLALEHAGLSGPGNPAALYAGSWSHWSADPDRPAATGEQPS
ncbi:sulfurtransferase [Saccharopolyspora gloriosae]|uniref:Thiosulfate/3-mercaptopyruvate sulfurtransferase n=1 Tax=Saccharopolyspora gloriosae TaxID=455344 RepID=A0A840N9C0_9PSEU|nr:sulfurtransferase [Saccharopolyspora gloriosae]MBB5068224.1 thiosulfate/3-mercaptopyruvate sulfurtransferase [Saccharopolyspora gloriosae]